MRAVVTALGACSPVGLNAEQTAFGIRNGHLAPRRTRFVDPYGDAVGMSILTGISDDLVGKARMIELATAALEECIGSSGAAGEGGARESKGKTVVLLGCPSPRRGFESDDGRDILASVVRASNVDACPERSTAFAVGHASFALALARAGEILAAGEPGPVFVGAVDTHYDESAVAHFGEQDRILSHRTTSGFLPAEGAAFLALRSSTGSGAVRAPRAPDFGQVTWAGSALEETVTLGKPNLARALTELHELAAKSRGIHAEEAFGWYLRTVNREQHRAREDRFVGTRLGKLLDDTVLDELAARIGDAGAASGALLGVYVAYGFASGYAPASSAVVSLASEGPERGLFIMTRGERS